MNTAIIGKGIATGNPVALVRIKGNLTAVKFPITIDGWAIEPEDNVWAMKYGSKFKASNDGKTLTFGTLEEAIEEISTH